MKLMRYKAILLASVLTVGCTEEPDAPSQSSPTVVSPVLQIESVILTDEQESKLKTFEEAAGKIDQFKDPQGYKTAYMDALVFAKTLYSEPHPKLEDFKLEAAFGDFMLGNVDVALKALEDSLPIYEAAGAGYRDKRIEINNNLGVAHNAAGNSEKAIPFLEAAIAEWRIKYAGKPEINMAIALDNLAMAHNFLGRSELALEKNLEALSIIEQIEDSKIRNDQLVVSMGNRSKYLGEALRYEESRANSLALVSRLDELIGKDHPRGAYVLSSLATVLIELRQYQSAEDMARRAVDLRETHFGRDKPETAVARNVLVNALLSQAKYEQALPLADYNYQVLKESRGFTAEQTLAASDFRSRALFGIGRIDEALVLQKDILEATQKKGSETTYEFQTTAETYLQMLLISGRFEDAKGVLGMSKLSDISNSQSLIYHNAVMIQNAINAALQPDIELTSAFGESEKWLDAAFAAELSNSGNLGDSNAKLRIAYGHALKATFLRGDAEGSFRLMQKYNMGSLGKARAKSILRESFTRRSEKANLVALQDAQETRTETLQDIYAATSEGDIQRVTALSLTLEVAEMNIQTLQAEFSRKTGSAKIIAVEDLFKVQAKLGSDAALLMMTETAYGLHVLLVTDDDIHMTVLELSALKAVLPAISSRLRSKVNASDDISIFTDFGDLIFSEDIRRLIGDRGDLAVIANGSIAQTPLSVARYKTGTGAYRWAVEDYAFSYPTSVSDLVPQAASKVMVVNSFVGVGFSQTPSNKVDESSISLRPFSLAYRSVGDVERLAKLPALQSAGTELRLMSDSLSPKSSQILADRVFSESDVRTLDLASADVLSFATHGLMAGELEGYNEAALVLSSTGTSGEAVNDGLLTASEISDLTLSAEWVVLSACNSGSGSRERDEALSGLATAFTYAGAKSLLVSHWPVRDDAAALLTVQTVENSQQGMSKAKALQKAMNDLRENSNIPNASDPAVWAPFVLIGQ